MKRLALIFLLAGSIRAANTVAITNTTGATQTTTPYTISSVFAQGDIRHFAQASISGGVGLVATQCDVKTRWPDGSVQHALNSFVVASLAANATITITWLDQASGNNTGQMSKAAMQAVSWGAQIQATNGTTQTADAQTILAAWDGTDGHLGGRYWLKGSICTQIILEDRTWAFTYDMGWDAFKPLHPMFVVTFYPTTSFGPKVELILENDWDNKREDQTYSLVLQVGSPLATVYSKASQMYSFGTRWRKIFWSGPQPGAVSIDYNFAYLKSTMAIPNFDPGITVNPNAATADVNQFNASDKCDVGNTFGPYTVPMDSAGAHAAGELAVIQKFYVHWLYTMSPNLYAILPGMAECGNHVVGALKREGGTGLFYDSAGTIDAFGLPYSLDARPTGAPAPVGGANAAANPWVGNLSATVSHYPGFAYLPYLVFGDYYFLETLQLTAGAASGTGWGPYYRGGSVPSLANGTGGQLGYLAFTVQTRGQAWGLRDTAEAAFISPDGTPQKAYFTQKLKNSIAIEEGQMGILNGAFVPSDPTCAGYNPGFTGGSQAQAAPNAWCYGHIGINYYTNAPHNVLTTNLHFNGQGDPGLSCVDPDVSGGTEPCVQMDSPWMIGYKWHVLGHIQELGFPIAAYNNVSFQFLVHMVQDSAYNPYLIGGYRIPIMRASTHDYYTTWVDLLLGQSASYACAGHGSINLQSFVGFAQDFCNGGAGASNTGAPGYPHIAHGASAYASQFGVTATDSVTGSTITGTGAYAWLSANVGFQAGLSNQSFAIVPRSNICTVTPSTLGPFTVGQVVSVTFVASNCVSSAWTDTGTWPTGLTFTDSTGVLAGTVGGSASTYTTTVTYSTDTTNYSIVVNAVPSLTSTSPLAAGSVSIPYSVTLAATGGSAPLTWAKTGGALPTGLTLSAAGVISGTPTTVTGSPFSATITATDVKGFASSPVSFSITIGTACAIIPAALGPWTAGQAINTTFTTSSCSASSFTQSGVWPTGITFTNGSGVLAGTVGGSAGVFTPSVLYSTATNAFSIVVNAAPSIVTTSPLPDGQVSVAYSKTLVPTGGTAPYTWSVSSGTVPTGTSLSAGGVLSGTPTTVTGSPFSFTALVADANSITASQAFSVTIAAAPPSSAVAVVQHTPSCYANATATVNCSFGGATVAGNSIIVEESARATGDFPVTPTDNAGNAYVLISSTAQAALYIYTYEASGATLAATTVTCKQTTVSAHMTCGAVEVSGLSAVVDTSSSKFTSSGASPFACSPIATANKYDYILTTTVNQGNSTVWTAPTGFTLEFSQVSGFTQGATSDSVITSTGTFSPSWSATGTSASSWLCSVVAIQGNSFAITGTVGGFGGSGATVTLSGAASAIVNADSDGNYSFSGLTPGSYTVTPSNGSMVFSPTSLSETVSSSSIAGANFSTATAITVSLPTVSTYSCSVSGTTLSGFSCPFTVATPPAPALYSVEFDVDGEIMIPPGTATGGIIYAAPYTSLFNTFYVGNGQHSVVATMRDALNNTIGTPSAAVPFSVENDMPQNLPGTNCGSGGSAPACTDITVTPSLVAPLTLSSPSPYTANVVTITGTAPAVVGSATTGSATATSKAIARTFGSGHSGWVYVFWASSSATLTVTDDSSDAVTCLTPQPNAGVPETTEWCYFPSVTSGSRTITASITGPSVYIAATLIEVSGSGVSPLDRSVNTTSAGGNPQSAPFLPTAAPELILAGFGWQGLNPGNAGKGYTLQAAQTETAVESASYSTLGNIFGTAGFSVTVNGPVATQSHGVNIFVDGLNVQSITSTTSATSALTFDSSAFLNATHKIVISAAGGTSCVTCGNASWTWMGGYENSFTFSNPVVPSQLLLSAREVTIVGSGGSGNCGGGSTCTLTGTIQNTDGSASAATLTGCVSANTAVVTISGTCTINHVAAGVTSVTATESGGKTRLAWIYDLPTNAVPHFSKTGTILSAYNPATSFWHTSLFGGNILNGTDAPLYTAAQACADTLAGGYTTAEASSPSPPLGTEAAWSGAGGTVATWIATNVTNVASACPSLKFHLISDSYFRGTPQMFPAIYGPGASYSTPAWQYFIQQVTNLGNFIANSMIDEVGGAWSGSPLLGLGTGGILIGTNGWSSLAGNGSSCTITSGGSGYPSLGYTAARTFLITGSGQSTLDYNTATNAPIFTQSNGVFPCSFSGTITSGTTQIHPFVAWAFDAAGNACSPTSGQLGGGFSSGPCTQWIHYNFAQIARTWTTNVAGYPPMTWPCAAGCSRNSVSQWQGGTLEGQGPLGDYGEYYWSPGANLYLPSRVVLTDVINTFANGFRTNAYPYLNGANPFLMETAGTAVDYTPQGYPVPMASCVGNTITTTIPHGLASPLPGSSRLWISGSSGGLCDSAANSGLYVVATPTSTTITVASALPSQSVTGSGGSISFTGGPTYANGPYFTTLDSGSTTSIGSGGNINGVANNCPGNPIPNYRGFYFTGSGWSNAYFNTHTFWLNWNGVDSCTRTPRFYEVPNFSSSTGGTVFIVAENDYIRGRSWQSNAEIGQWYVSADKYMCIMLGCAGDRQYSFGASAEVYDRTGRVNGGGGGVIAGSSFDTNSFNSNITFQQTDAQTLQAGINPHWDYARSFVLYSASTYPNLLGQRLLKYNLQPRLPSPDYGQFFETAARTGSYGNILEIQSFAENTTSLTASLSAYLESGQPIGRLCSTWAGIEPLTIIAAGTTTDVHTYQPGEFCAYIFAVNEAAEFQQPVVSARLADVANAADLIVQFSYSPLAFTTQSVASQLLYQTFDLGSSGVGLLPVDRQIGVLYYRFVYRDTTGRVLATSDVQTL